MSELELSYGARDLQLRKKPKPFCFGPSTAASNGQMINDKVSMKLLFNLYVEYFCICEPPMLILPSKSTIPPLSELFAQAETEPRAL